MPASNRFAGRMPERGVSMLQRSVVKCVTCDVIVLSFLSSPTRVRMSLGYDARCRS